MASPRTVLYASPKTWCRGKCRVDYAIVSREGETVAVVDDEKEALKLRRQHRGSRLLAITDLGEYRAVFRVKRVGKKGEWVWSSRAKRWNWMRGQREELIGWTPTVAQLREQANQREKAGGI